MSVSDDDTFTRIGTTAAAHEMSEGVRTASEAMAGASADLNRIQGDRQVSQAVARMSEQVPAPLSETAAVIGILERAIRDTSIDLDRMERLIALQERMLIRQAEERFDAAMALAQADMRAVAADSVNPQTKSKYASYFALDKVLRPIYTRHGFSLSFNTGEGAAESFVRVLCRVAHSAGHSRQYQIDMPADGKGAKGGDVMTKTHATGSAVTYGTRYLLKMIFNTAVGEGDDDGNAAGAADAGPLTELQLKAIRSKIEELGANEQKVCAFKKVDQLEELPAKQFDAVMSALNDWAKRAAK